METRHACSVCDRRCMDTMTSGQLRRRADRIYRVVDRLYATGRIEWGHRWAAEWHQIASALRARGIDIYRP